MILYIQQFGIHPTEIAENEEKILEEIKEIEVLAKSPKVVAIGEIGLDYYWVKEEEKRSMQKFSFLEQIKLANKLNLPIIIHSRDAIMDTIEILKGDIKPEKHGILHCCQLNKDLVKAGLEVRHVYIFCRFYNFQKFKKCK
ncbi:MAG: hypothetical protein HFJ24_00210 [Clostridia bacterium]|nr:hypothetical protein [Clostridia bacterium]